MARTTRYDSSITDYETDAHDAIQRVMTLASVNDFMNAIQ